MRPRLALLALLALSLSTYACSKKKEKGDISASLMKSQTVSSSLALDEEPGAALTADAGSTTQSFTPASLKIAIFKVSLCQGSGGCRSVYSCAANTVEGCYVELSDIDAFVDTLNAGAAEIEEGETFDHVGVEFCQDGNRDEIQHISVRGNVSISGTSYGTDPTAGLVAGAEGKDTAIDVHGGCASYYAMDSIKISADDNSPIKMFFDASYSVYAGVAGGASNTYSYNDGGGCAGNSSAYVCAPVVTVVATVDAGNPTTEHYLLADTTADTGGSADSAPTATVVLYYNSAGKVLGGVQNPFRISGPSVSWGTAMAGGLGLVPKEVDASTVSFGEPEGSISLANWFKAFKRESHTGTYTYDHMGTAKDGEYKATKI